MASTKQIIFSLDNFVAGNKLKIFSSNNQNYFTKSNTQLSSLNNDANFYYFYRDNKKIKLAGDYSNEAVSTFQKSLDDNNDNDNVYINNQISGLYVNSKSGLARNNDNYYFINKFKFKNNLILDEDDYRRSFVSGYISASYLSSFYQNSLLVEDQTIPIYRFNEEQLKDIDVIKFQSQQIVNDIINQFQLNDIKDQITYNTKTDKLDQNQYDAIYILPILQHYINLNRNFDNFYKFIFSNLSKDSFYRLFIPIGKISKIESKQGIKKTSEISQYMYYLNPKQNKLLQKDTSNQLSFNYFDLKSLQNPHDEYDYAICGNVNQNLSVKSNAFSLDWMNKFNIINFTSQFIKGLQNFIQNRYWKIYADQYIKINGLFDQVVQFGYNTYDRWTSQQMSALMLSKDSYFKFTVIEEAFESLYDLDVNLRSYLVTYNQILAFINASQLEFQNKFEDEKYSQLITKCLGVFQQVRNIYILSYVSADEILFNQSIETLLTKLKGRNFPSLQNVLLSCDICMYQPVMRTVFNNLNAFNNYYKSFDTLFSHQNVMKKDGVLLGYRTYDKVFTSFDNYLNATYNYCTLDDKGFKDSISSNFNQEAYQKTLNDISKYQFIEKVEGFFKYKDLNLPKSNIYSIQLKNSNLNYVVYSYDQIIKYCLNNYPNDASSYNYQKKCFIKDLRNKHIKDPYMVKTICLNLQNDYNNVATLASKNTSYIYDKLLYIIDFNQIEEIPFMKFIDSHNIGIMLQSNLNQNVDLLKLRKRIWDKIPLSSFKYYDKNNQLNQNIQLKIEMRKRLQSSIRQSIVKYMPVDTTLWKITYTGI